MSGVNTGDLPNACALARFAQYGGR